MRHDTLLRRRQRDALTMMVARSMAIRPAQFFRELVASDLCDAGVVSSSGILRDALDEAEKHPKSSRIYTLGYEGRGIGDFLATLLGARVTDILDVREHASSRKLGFSERMLARLASKIGITYHHIPELGVPREHRELFGNLSTVALARNEYRRRIERNIDVLADAAALCRDGRAALVCYERDARYCHRYALSTMLREMTQLEVQHL